MYEEKTHFYYGISIQWRLAGHVHLQCECIYIWWSFRDCHVRAETEQTSGFVRLSQHEASSGPIVGSLHRLLQQS